MITLITKLVFYFDYVLLHREYYNTIIALVLIAGIIITCENVQPQVPLTVYNGDYTSNIIR